MRLINSLTYELHEFTSDDAIPSFAILSHTWGAEECTFQQMSERNVASRQGFAKIKLCCEQARQDGYDWAWIDTCCIDKTSTAELSEAINSMFRWYGNADMCYAYLPDAPRPDRLPEARWFTRGWTLQELVASKRIHFYGTNWTYLGSKQELRAQLRDITGIDDEVLSTGRFEHISIARKMFWAARRQTTRVEDQSYCLLGIFEVSMPLLYGEGKKAFLRLQEEIMKVSDDQSLFAWGLPAKPLTFDEYCNMKQAPEKRLTGLFATSPSDFTFSYNIHVLDSMGYTTIPPIVSNNGVQIELQVLPVQRGDERFEIVALYCALEGSLESYLGFPLTSWGQKWKARNGELLLIEVRHLFEPNMTGPYRQHSTCLIKEPPTIIKETPQQPILKIVRLKDGFQEYYTMEDVVCSPNATFTNENQSIMIHHDLDALHAAVFFNPNLDIYHPIGLNEAIYSQDHELSKSTYKHRSGGGAIAQMIQPSFVILVGGKRNAPWIDTLLILNDENTDKDFHFLLDTNRYTPLGGPPPYQMDNLAGRCTTRSQILAALRNNSTAFLNAAHTPRMVKPIAHWDRRRLLHPMGDLNQGDLFVDASIQLSKRNLVEQGLFLLIELGYTKNKLGKKRDANWWLYT